MTVLATRRWMLLTLLLLMLQGIALNTLESNAEVLDSAEYERFVHTFLDSSSGNCTFVEKPVFPIFLNDSQLQIGRNWSIICPLRANHSYHAYCYGEWIDLESEPVTDYDIYIYNPSGDMESWHTEAAGLPEHLSVAVDEPFLVPRQSGNHTFLVNNDPRESNGSEQATFMVIENVDCNKWYGHYVKGKENELHVLETSWSYEFVTDSRHIEVLVRVPDTLDMYEARLYLMTNPKSEVETVVSGVPLPWEAGLYGYREDLSGGFNLESRDYRGVAYASCEFFGEDMLINFSSPYEELSLYHLVLIGEEGSGTIEFLVKTEFEDACLIPSVLPEAGYPNENEVVSYVSNITDLENATLIYSTDNWQSTVRLAMEIVDNRTCTGLIQGQEAGAFVEYSVEARDVLENVLTAYGNFSVKHPSHLNMSLAEETLYLGQNITVVGYLTPPEAGLPVIISFKSENGSGQTICNTISNGTFTSTFRPETLGIWKVRAMYLEDNLRYSSESVELMAKVEDTPFLVKYSLYLGGAFGVTAVLGIVVYIKKFRG